MYNVILFIIKSSGGMLYIALLKAYKCMLIIIMKRLFEHIVMTDHLLEHLVHVVVKYVYCCMCVYMYVCVCICIQS